MTRWYHFNVIVGLSNYDHLTCEIYFQNLLRFALSLLFSDDCFPLVGICSVMERLWLHRGACVETFANPQWPSSQWGHQDMNSLRVSLIGLACRAASPSPHPNLTAVPPNPLLGAWHGIGSFSSAHLKKNINQSRSPNPQTQRVQVPSSEEEEERRGDRAPSPDIILRRDNDFLTNHRATWDASSSSDGDGEEDARKKVPDVRKDDLASRRAPRAATAPRVHQFLPAPVCSSRDRERWEGIRRASQHALREKEPRYTPGALAHPLVIQSPSPPLHNISLFFFFSSHLSSVCLRLRAYMCVCVCVGGFVL